MLISNVMWITWDFLSWEGRNIVVCKECMCVLVHPLDIDEILDIFIEKKHQIRLLYIKSLNVLPVNCWGNFDIIIYKEFQCPLTLRPWTEVYYLWSTAEIDIARYGWLVCLSHQGHWPQQLDKPLVTHTHTHQCCATTVQLTGSLQITSLASSYC